MVFGVKIKSLHPEQKKHYILDVLYNYYSGLEDQVRECEKVRDLDRSKQINSEIMHGSLSTADIVNRLKIHTLSLSRVENISIFLDELSGTDVLKSISELLKELHNDGAIANPRLDSYSLTTEQTRAIRAKKIDQSLGSVIYNPTIHVGKIATDTSAVRSDFNSDKWRLLPSEISQRNIYGLEMEGYGLYMAAHVHNDLGKSRTKILLVKAVSDLANNKKNDTYHQYGKQLSAAYIYALIDKQTFSTASRMHGSEAYRDSEELGFKLHQELMTFERIIKEGAINRDCVLEKIKTFLQNECLYQRTPYLELEQQKESIFFDVGVLFVVSIDLEIEVNTEDRRVHLRFPGRITTLGERQKIVCGCPETHISRGSNCGFCGSTRQVLMQRMRVKKNFNLLFLNDGKILEDYNLRNAYPESKTLRNLESIAKSLYGTCRPSERTEMTAEGVSLEKQALVDTNHPPPDGIVDRIFNENDDFIKSLEITPIYQKAMIQCYATNIIKFTWEKLGECTALVAAVSDLLYPISTTKNP